MAHKVNQIGLGRHWLENQPFIRNQRLWLLFVIAFAFKLSFVAWLSSLAIESAPDRGQGRLSLTTGDTFSYLGSIENYLNTGEYYFWNGEEKVKAGRMPHYGAPYYLFRLFVSQAAAGDLMVVSQVLLEAIALVLLSLIGYSLMRRAASFWLIYLISLVSLNSTIWNMYLAPESFSISFLVISLYFYSQYRAKGEFGNLIVCGVFLGLTVVLKPYFLLLYIPLLFEVAQKAGLRPDARAITRFVSGGLAIGVSLALLLLPWVIRNYGIYGKIVPFQINTTAGYRYTEADFAFRRFVQAWGGSFIFWDKRSAGCYFQPQKELECEFTLPAYALAEGYTVKDVEDVRRDYIALQQNPSASLMRSVASRFDRLTEIYRSERPFRYYILSPLLLVRELIFHSGSYYLPVKREAWRYSPYKILLKGSQSFLYYFTLALGMIGLVVLTARRRISLIFLSVPLLIVLFFCIVIKAPEFRYFIHTYPLFIVGTVYCLMMLSAWVEPQKNVSAIRVCAFVPYAPDTTPSQRFRIEQWMNYLRDHEGVTVELAPFADEELMELLRLPGRRVTKAAACLRAFARSAGRVMTSGRYDVVVIHRAIALAGPALLERLLKIVGRPIIYEFDDAIFLLHTSEVNRRFGWLKFPKKTAAICRLSSQVVVGNEWLAEYARQFNDQVAIIPTSIETERYRVYASNGDHNGNGYRVVVGWTGSSTSQTYLEWFAPVLSEFVKSRDVELRVISDREPALPGIPYVWLPWRAETEVEDVTKFDIGIMPMPDDQWARGKCACKALQYMAAGKPVVCSAIGANLEVIRHGENGLLAATPEEWIQNLGRLVDDPALRLRLGEAGRRTVEEKYSMQRCARMFAEVVRETLRRHYGERERD